MTSFIRRKVSQNRFRLENGRYDLDMTYICDNIIAMGLPADTFIQSVARNPLETVSRYLKENHNECYKIYNLLKKAKYDYTQFDNMVESYPMHDHYPPVFNVIERFCSSVHEWLSKRKENVAVVHCKAGKGRTGTMISCYFLYSDKFQSPFEAMDYFSTKRCVDGKGVTIPSQRRYVEYFADYLHNKRIYKEIDLYLKQIDIDLPDNSYFNTISFQVLKENAIKLYDHEYEKLSFKRNGLNLVLKNPIKISGDVKIAFLSKQLRNKNCIFHLTFNTYFLMQNISTANNEKSCLGQVVVENNNNVTWTLFKKDVDVACKDKRFSPEMKLVFHFERNAPSIESTNPFLTKNEFSKQNFTAFDNMHITDDNGQYSKPPTENENINNKKLLNTNGLNNTNGKINLTRSDSYVTPKPIVFDLQNDEAQQIDKEKSILDRLNIKTKVESRKVLITEQSRTSSESSDNDSDLSSKSDSQIQKQIEIPKTSANIINKANEMKRPQTMLIESKQQANEDGHEIEASSANKHSNKKKFSFFKNKKFFSLKKPNKIKLNKKYQRQRNNSNANNDTIEENSQSYDLLSNSSNNKMSSSNNNLNLETDLKVKDENLKSKSNENNNKNENYMNFSNDANEDYDDEDDEFDEGDDDDGSFKKEKNSNLKNFFARIKPN